MKFLAWFRSLTRAKQIALCVAAFHFALVFALSIHHLASRSFSPKRPIVVRTKIPTSSPKPAPVSPKKTPPSPIAKKEPIASQSPKPKQKQQPPASKNSSPKPAKEARPVSKTPGLKQAEEAVALPKSPSPQQNQLLKEIAESFDQLTKTEEVPVSQNKLSIPSFLPSKAVEVEASTLDPTYGEFLIGYLQASLDLPEFGEVKAKLEINREGRLVSCTILDSRSRKNSEFLKNRLPELAYPCFNDFHIDETTLNFTITFRNVETD